MGKHSPRSAIRASFDFGEPYVLEAEVTPGNVHDSVVFDRVFDRLVERCPEAQAITADAGYKTPWICKQVFDSGRIPSPPHKRPMTKKGNLP